MTDTAANSPLSEAPVSLRRSTVALFALLALATFASYLPAIRGEFIWDDDRHVSNNHTLLSLHGLRHIWLDPRFLPQWYPLTHTSFWLEYRVFGLHTLGYHVDNILLHLVNVFLLWRLLRLLKIPGAALAATIFALHPIEVESVAWISERKNLLSTCFALLSIDTYLRSRRWEFWAASLLFFVLAMLSKTVACSTPAVLLVLIAWRRRVNVSDLLRLLPFFVIGVGLAMFTARTEANYVGASGPEWNLSAARRLLIAGRAAWFYAGKLLVPVNLTFNYPRWNVSSRAAWQVLSPVALAVVVISLWLLRRRFGRGPVVGVILFVGVLVPALGFFNTYPMRYSFVADHFQYTAGIAGIVLASSLIVRFVPQRVAIVILGVLLAILTARQSRAYAGPEALWRDVIAKNPSSWLARENLAVTYSLTGRPAEALPLFAEVAVLKPNHEMVQANWGDALTKLGRWDEAIAHYRAALSSPKLDPSAVHDRIGQSLVRLNRLPEAIGEFETAVKLRADDVAARLHLASTLAESGDYPAASNEIDQALRQWPDSEEALAMSARFLLKLNRPNEAADRMNHAVEVNPNDRVVRMIFGRLLLQLNRPAEAAKQFSAILDADPNDVKARQGLMQALNPKN